MCKNCFDVSVGKVNTQIKPQHLIIVLYLSKYSNSPSLMSIHVRRQNELFKMD